MKPEEEIRQALLNAEKRIKELHDTEAFKKLTEEESIKTASFYEERSTQRIQTAKIIYELSKDELKKKMNMLPIMYSDYAETVAGAYYAMYYIVHAYLAKEYHKKIARNIRGIHAITHQLVLFYLVKTGKLAQHLYDEYISTLLTVSELQSIEITKTRCSELSTG